MKTCVYNDVDHLLSYIITPSEINSFKGGRDRTRYLRENK